MPSHSVKQAKVMSAISHGWKPSQGSVAKIPVSVAKEFHAADAGHKYGKGHDKARRIAKRQAKKYADGGEVTADDMVKQANQQLATQKDRMPMHELPDVGEPMIGDGGQFSAGHPMVNKAADIASRIAGPMAIDVGTAGPLQSIAFPFPNQGEPPKGKASGGSVSHFDPERSSAYGLARQGMIKSSVPGRTDKINMNVPGGSYVIPADIVSALGEGNSMAGSNILSKMFASNPYGANKGPYGMNLPRAKAGTARIGTRKSSLTKIRKFAEGGSANPAPIVVAGGEYTILPETVAHLGGGDIDLGHDILDSFIKQVREKNIQTLKGLKPPKGSK